MAPARVGPVSMISIRHTDCVWCGTLISKERRRRFHSTCSPACLIEHILDLEVTRTGLTPAAVMAELVAAREGR